MSTNDQAKVVIQPAMKREAVICVMLASTGNVEALVGAGLRQAHRLGLGYVTYADIRKAVMQLRADANRAYEGLECVSTVLPDGTVARCVDQVVEATPEGKAAFDALPPRVQMAVYESLQVGAVGMASGLLVKGPVTAAQIEAHVAGLGARGSNAFAVGVQS